MGPEPGDGRGRLLSVAVTGGIACGKSEVLRCLSAMGVSVLDTDRVAHEVMCPEGPAYGAVVSRFGAGILRRDGTIDRSRLGALVFGDADALAALNARVHPHVGRIWRAWREDQRRAGASSAVAIPLLFEVGATDGWDAIVCVAAPDDIVMERLRGRGLDEKQARRRIDAQWPLEEKIRRSDIVVHNDGTLEQLATRVMASWNELTRGE